jgi:hypothetical protein
VLEILLDLRHRTGWSWREDTLTAVDEAPTDNTRSGGCQ